MRYIDSKCSEIRQSVTLFFYYRTKSPNQKKQHTVLQCGTLCVVSRQYVPPLSTQMEPLNESTNKLSRGCSTIGYIQAKCSQPTTVSHVHLAPIIVSDKTSDKSQLKFSVDDLHVSCISILIPTYHITVMINAF